MRIPDPIANTTTEAYLAYKAGVLSEGDLKPKLYDPYIHLDAWLAYWAGLTKDYPVKNVGKNLFNKNTTTDGYRIGSDGKPYADAPYTLSWYIPVKPNTTYTISFGSVLDNPSYTNIASYSSDKTFIYRWIPAQVGSYTLTTQADAQYLRVATPLNREDTTQCELGSTATAYEPYSGEPEMLTDEEALIAYLSGVTNTYPEEFRDPADVRVAAYLKYLVSARWGRPEYPVTNEELYLSMMDAPYIPAGEPSSDIEIDDTAEAPFKDVKMYGDTSQTTYTGKNLFNDATALNSYIQSNGSVTPNDVWRASQLIKVKPNTSYIWHGEVYGANQVVWAGYNTSSAFVSGQYAQVNGASSLVITTGASTEYLRVGYRSDGMRNMQLELGSTATSFEPYVGGVPAPNPDYPQAVQTVTGENVVEIYGKNIFNKDKALDNYFYTSTGSKSTYSKAQFYNNKFIPKSDKITMSFSAAHDRQSGSVIAANVRIVQYDANGNFISRLMSKTNGYTFTLDANTKSFILCIDNGPDAWFDDLQVEYGTATTYEPYQSQSYPISLGSIELCKIGTYQDYIYKDGTDWKIKKQVGKFVLESAKVQSAYDKRYRYAKSDLDNAYLPTNGTNFLCEYFTAAANSSYGIGSIYSGGTMLNFRYDENGDNIAGFKNFIDEVGLSLYCQLNSFPDITITNQALIDQLNALKNGGSYTGTTYIKVSATDPNLPGLLKVEAYKYD